MRLLVLCLILGLGHVLQAAPPVTALAFSPDGKYLAAAVPGFVYLFNANGEILDLVRESESKCTALAFSSNSKHLILAVGAPGQKGLVRIFSVPQLQLVRSISAHHDLIQGLAISHDGKRLATAGYDRLIKLWEPASGKEIATLKDHSDAVYAVAWNPAGTRLASVAADRSVKVWDAASGKRLFTLGESTDWLYCLAWSPDGNRLAAAGVDKSIRIWNIRPESGSLIHTAFAHEKGILALTFSGDGNTLFSAGEDRLIKSWRASDLTLIKIFDPLPDAVLSMAISPAADGSSQKDHQPLSQTLAVGSFDGALTLFNAATRNILSKPLPEFYPLVKLAPVPTQAQAPMLPLPCQFLSSIPQAGQQSFFAVDLKAGQEIGFQLKTGGPSKLDAVLELRDAAGATVARSPSPGLLGYTAPVSGRYTLAVRDADYRGGPEFTFRVLAGPLPIITSFFPLGAQKGVQTLVSVRGVHLGVVRDIPIHIPDQSTPGKRFVIPWPSTASKPINPPSLWIGENPEVGFSATGVNDLPIPGTANGCLNVAGAVHEWRFTARKGQRLIVEVNAQRLGSHLDSTIEILDAKKQPIERAALRSQAKTFITLRDRDASDRGLRLENWDGFGLNDFVYAGTELLRLQAMPKGPDEDCFFRSEAGKRIGYLGTTPRAQPLGGAVYRVEVHPAHAQLPPNGFPIFKIQYRNDDGPPRLGKDSRLVFDPPEDGIYYVQITDAQSRGGFQYAYRLSMSPPQPDFAISLSNPTPKIWAQGGTPFMVKIQRQDDWEGSVLISVENLDSQFSVSKALLHPEDESATLVVTPTQKTPTNGRLAPFTIRAEALIEGKKVVREVSTQPGQIIPAGDLETFLESSAVSLQPGGQAKVSVRVERRNGFKGRVPVEVRGLPFGVQVLDVGLNGILITETDSQRTFTLKAEPWVTRQIVPIVVLAKCEGKNTEHAAPALLLKIAP